MSDNIIDRLKTADPFIEIDDKLYGPIAMLRTAWQALSNPESVENYGLKYCLTVLEDATDEIRQVQECARRYAAEIDTKA